MGVSVSGRLILFIDSFADRALPTHDGEKIERIRRFHSTQREKWQAMTHRAFHVDYLANRKFPENLVPKAIPPGEAFHLIAVGGSNDVLTLTLRSEKGTHSI